MAQRTTRQKAHGAKPYTRPGGILSRFKSWFSGSSNSAQQDVEPEASTPAEPVVPPAPQQSSSGSLAGPKAGLSPSAMVLQLKEWKKQGMLTDADFAQLRDVIHESNQATKPPPSTQGPAPILQLLAYSHGAGRPVALPEERIMAPEPSSVINTRLGREPARSAMDYFNAPASSYTASSSASGPVPSAPSFSLPYSRLAEPPRPIEPARAAAPAAVPPRSALFTSASTARMLQNLQRHSTPLSDTALAMNMSARDVLERKRRRIVIEETRAALEPSPAPSAAPAPAPALAAAPAAAAAHAPTPMQTSTPGWGKANENRPLFSTPAPPTTAPAWGKDPVAALPSQLATGGMLFGKDKDAATPAKPLSLVGDGLGLPAYKPLGTGAALPAYKPPTADKQPSLGVGSGVSTATTVTTVASLEPTGPMSLPSPLLSAPPLQLGAVAIAMAKDDSASAAQPESPFMKAANSKAARVTSLLSQIASPAPALAPAAPPTPTLASQFKVDKVEAPSAAKQPILFSLPSASALGPRPGSAAAAAAATFDFSPARVVTPPTLASVVPEPKDDSHSSSKPARKLSIVQEEDTEEQTDKDQSGRNSSIAEEDSDCSDNDGKDNESVNDDDNHDDGGNDDEEPVELMESDDDNNTGTTSGAADGDEDDNEVICLDDDDDDDGGHDDHANGESDQGSSADPMRASSQSVDDVGDDDRDDAASTLSVDVPMAAVDKDSFGKGTSSSTLARALTPVRRGTTPTIALPAFGTIHNEPVVSSDTKAPTFASATAFGRKPAGIASFGAYTFPSAAVVPAVPKAAEAAISVPTTGLAPPSSASASLLLAVSTAAAATSSAPTFGASPFGVGLSLPVFQPPASSGPTNLFNLGLGVVGSSAPTVFAVPPFATPTTPAPAAVAPPAAAPAITSATEAPATTLAALPTPAAPAAGNFTFGGAKVSMTFGKPAETTASKNTPAFGAPAQGAAQPPVSFAAAAPGAGFVLPAFGAPAASGAPGLVFGAPSTPAPAVTAAPSAAAAPFGVPPLFGGPATSAAPTPSFGAPAFGLQPSSFAPATSAAPALTFGAPASGTPALVFGAPATSAAPGLTFGAPATSAAPGLTFGAPATSAAPGLMFGAPATSAAPGLTFGAPATSAAPGLTFGAPATSAAPAPAFGATMPFGAPAFGGSSMTFAAPAASSVHANTAPAPAFGSSNTSLFGAPAAGPVLGASNLFAGSGLFGGNTPSTSSAPAFGAPGAAPFSFGVPASGSNTFVFGSNAAAPASGGMFQAPPSSNPAPAMKFGAATPTPFGNSAFGAPAGGMFGSAPAMGAPAPNFGGAGMFGNSAVPGSPQSAFGGAGPAAGGMFGNNAGGTNLFGSASPAAGGALTKQTSVGFGGTPSFGAAAGTFNFGAGSATAALPAPPTHDGTGSPVPAFQAGSGASSGRKIIKGRRSASSGHH